jgi:hypothetical protein
MDHEEMTTALATITTGLEAAVVIGDLGAITNLIADLGRLRKAQADADAGQAGNDGNDGQRNVFQPHKAFAASVDDGADNYQLVVLATDREAAESQVRMAYHAEVGGNDVDDSGLDIGLTEVDAMKCYHFFG